MKITDIEVVGQAAVLADHVPPARHRAARVAGVDRQPTAYGFDVDPEAWAEEAEAHLKFLRTFGSRLPEALVQEQAALVRRIAEARASGQSPKAVAAK